MAKVRDRLKILYDMTKTIQGTLGKCLYLSAITKACRLEPSTYYDRADRYFEVLRDYGLITIASPQGKREATLTKKGKAFIFYYEQILNLFSGHNYMG